MIRQKGLNTYYEIDNISNISTYHGCLQSDRCISMIPVILINRFISTMVRVYLIIQMNSCVSVPARYQMDSLLITVCHMKLQIKEHIIQIEITCAPY